MISKIDNCGRIVIPKGFRRKLDMLVGENVEITECDGHIMITPIKNCCALCRNTENLTEFHSKYICTSCFEKIKELKVKEG